MPNNPAKGREAQPMQRITPCLWFDHQAEEAAEFYVSIFSALGESAAHRKKSRIVSVARYGEAGSKAAGRPAGSAMTVSFQLEGEEFLALNGGPIFIFSPAISFIVNCKTQAEVDLLWERLSEGGRIEQCGWLQDKYGVSWQIIPTILIVMLQDMDARKSESVMKAMLQMKKIDIKTLRQAYKLDEKE
jgi:predicted 3-demethylubiquinone-9 3-methyltransferase (glyoxalase superfamily)